MSPLESFSRAAVEIVSARLLLGRQFRSFVDFNIPSASSLVIRAEFGSDFVLQSQSLTGTHGEVRFAAVVGATETGSFSATVPVIAKNRTLSHKAGPEYSSVASLASGGSISGGTEVEVVRISAGTSGGHAQTVSGAYANPRMLPAGVYYLKLQNMDNSAAIGVYSIEWEEL